MTFEPSGDLEQPYVFEQCVVGGAVPKNYFPAVEKGVQEAVLKRTYGGVSGCRSEGSSLRRQLPSGRFLRDGIQGSGDAGV